MKLLTVAATLSFAVAVSAVANTTSSAQGTSPSEQACLAKCSSSDVDCQAACVGVPSPDETQVNNTTECSRNCDQGDGSPEDTKKYGECLAACASSYYWSDSSATPTHQVSKVTETVKPTKASTEQSTSISHGATQTSAEVIAANTATGAAAQHLIGIPIAGFAGALAAAIAL